MASSISGQATLKHHAFSSLPNCVQRVAPWNILFTCCGVSTSVKSASVRLSSRSKASSSIGSMDTDRQKSSGPQLCKMATRAGSLLCAASRGQDGPLRHNNATSARRTLSGEEVILFAPSFNWAGAAQGITVIHVARRGVAGSLQSWRCGCWRFWGSRLAERRCGECWVGRGAQPVLDSIEGVRGEGGGRVRSHGGQAMGEELLMHATGRDRGTIFMSKRHFPSNPEQVASRGSAGSHREHHDDYHRTSS